MADSTLRAIITADDQASRSFQRASDSLQKLGVTQERANAIAEKAWAQGTEQKGLRSAESALRKLGLTSQQAQGMLGQAGIQVRQSGQHAAAAAPGWERLHGHVLVTTRAFGGLRAALVGGLGLGAVGAAGLGAIGVSATKMAASVVESENLYNVSMGGMADAGREWSGSLQRDLRLNGTELRRNLGTFQAMFRGMGIGQQDALQLGKGLTQLSYDMASFYNLDPGDALDKLRSGIVGETEPLRQLGIIITEDTVKQYALQKGIITAGQEMSEQQKILARYGLILQSTSQAQGDLARTMDSPVNQMRIFRQQIDALMVRGGQMALPGLTAGFRTLNDEVLPRAGVALDQFAAGWSNMGDTGRREILGVAMLLVGTGPLISGIRGAYGAIMALNAAWASFGLLSKGGIVGAGAVAGAMALEADGARKLLDQAAKQREEAARIENGPHTNVDLNRAAQLRQWADDMEARAKAGGFWTQTLRSGLQAVGSAGEWAASQMGQLPDRFLNEADVQAATQAAQAYRTGTAAAGTYAGALDNLAGAYARVGNAAAVSNEQQMGALRLVSDMARDYADDVGEELSNAREQMQSYVSAPLVGETALQSAMAGIDSQIAAIKKSQAQKKLDRLNRRPARTEGQQLKRLEIQREILGYDEAQYSAAHGRLQAMASSQTALSYQAAAAGITQQAAKVKGLEAEYKARQEVVKTVEQYIKLVEREQALKAFYQNRNIPDNLTSLEVMGTPSPALSQDWTAQATAASVAKAANLNVTAPFIGQVIVQNEADEKRLAQHIGAVLAGIFTSAGTSQTAASKTLPGAE